MQIYCTLVVVLRVYKIAAMFFYSSTYQVEQALKDLGKMLIQCNEK